METLRLNEGRRKAGGRRFWRLPFGARREEIVKMLKTEITYYEHEINNSIFEKNENYIELMKKYLIKGKYSAQRGVRFAPPYNDPDNRLKDCSYFWELTQFLNKREMWLQGEMEKMGKVYRPYRYSAPNKCKKPEGAKREQGSDENEIIVKGDNNEEKFRLMSDQFGFMVGGSRTDFNSHPYGYLCELVKTETKKEDDKDKDYEEIAKCIYDTRTLGGGFLWGKAIWGTYNKARGGSKNSWPSKRYYYIEDRVDLTLLEIKHLFEWIELGMPEEDTCLFNKIGGDGTEGNRVDALYYIIKKKIESKEKGILEYIEWLQHFGTFKNYIQFFCFDDFVDENKTWMPFDIMESKLKWDDEHKRPRWEKVVVLEEPTKYKQRKDHSIYKNWNIDGEKRSAEELEQMLENVRILTLARSYQMQKVIGRKS